MNELPHNSPRRLVYARKKWSCYTPRSIRSRYTSRSIQSHCTTPSTQKSAFVSLRCTFCNLCIPEDALAADIVFHLDTLELVARLNTSPALDDQGRPLPVLEASAYTCDAPIIPHLSKNAYAWLVPALQLQCRPCATREVEQLNILSAYKVAHYRCVKAGYSTRQSRFIDLEGAVNLGVTRAAYDWHPLGGTSLESLASLYALQECYQESLRARRTHKQERDAACQRLGLRPTSTPDGYTSDRRRGQLPIADLVDDEEQAALLGLDNTASSAVACSLAGPASHPTDPSTNSPPTLSPGDYTILSFIACHGRIEAAKLLKLSPGSIADILDQIQHKLYAAHTPNEDE